MKQILTRLLSRAGFLIFASGVLIAAPCSRDGDDEVSTRSAAGAVVQKSGMETGQSPESPSRSTSATPDPKPEAADGASGEDESLLEDDPATIDPAFGDDSSLEFDGTSTDGSEQF